MRSAEVSGSKGNPPEADELGACPQNRKLTIRGNRVLIGAETPFSRGGLLSRREVDASAKTKKLMNEVG